MFKITVPNGSKYTGEIVGVQFTNGIGTTENTWVRDWFVEKGYDVEEVDTDISEMTLNKLKLIAKEKGIEGYSNMKKDELIEVIKRCE